MPRTADDGDGGVALAHRGPDGTAHVRLAPLLAGRGHGARSHRGHRLGDGLERDETVAAMLDHVVPPAFGVWLAGSGRQRTERVGTDRRARRRSSAISSSAASSGAPVSVLASGRSIARTSTPSGVGPGDGLPFGAERRQRCERRPVRMVDDVTEQRDRRDELFIADPRQRRRRLGRRLDEHDVGLQLVERLHDRARRTGTVVPDAEQVHRHARACQSSARQAS